jgi:D-alanyl-D-alanine carboxypeptidase
MQDPRPGAGEQMNSPAQRRKRQAAPPSSQQPHFYPSARRQDEHPEIPRIRRASLYLDQTRQRERRAEGEPEDTGQRTAPPPPARRPRPAAGPEHSITMVQHKRRRVYTPPPPARHTRPRVRSKRSWLDRLIQPVQRRVVVFTGLALAILLIAGVIFNITRPQAGSNYMSPGTDTTPAAVGQGSNPHELVITPAEKDHPAPPVFATSAYLLDADTGATLYAHNPFVHLPMMSTTKLMTAVLAFEHGNLDAKISISKAIGDDIARLSPDSTLMGIKKGETYTLRDLLYGLLLPSGNDAAIAIADGLAGNLPSFVAAMNQRAHQLGLLDTHYMNPHGLLATGNYSSAHDLAILGRYSMSIALLHRISGSETYVIPKTNTHPEHDLVNGNQFLWWYPGVDGGKPGYDGTSNFVQVISCTRNHHHLIGVVMHTINWWTDMRNLMNWGFDNFSWISPRTVDSQHNPIPFDYLWNYFASDKQENTIEVAGSRYYIYTGYAVSGPFLSYFDQQGGLKRFGYPTSMPMASGKSSLSQRFTQSTIQCDVTTSQCSSQ